MLDFSYGRVAAKQERYKILSTSRRSTEELGNQGQSPGASGRYEVSDERWTGCGWWAIDSLFRDTIKKQ
jgi:hypothetical protein